MLHKVSILTRLALLLSINILALTFDNVKNLIILTIISFLIWLSTRPSIDRIKFTALIVLPTMWSFVLMQGLFYSAEPKTVILVIIPPNFPIIGQLTGGLYLIYQGLIYGLVQSLRMVSVLLVGLAVAWSSNETEVFQILRHYLKSRKLTIAVGIAVRFLDEFQENLRLVRLNMRLMSETKNIFKKFINIVIPLTAYIIRKTYTITLALIYRGFTLARQEVGERPRLSVRDKVMIVLCLGIALVFAIMKILTLLFLYGILYVPQLSYLYTWVVYHV
ncbi:MAG: hypothetical protein GXO10_01855 [Crenarchaeota archaeon]|nr:hypothetical protein [Thermoproteota archaeon]